MRKLDQDKLYKEQSKDRLEQTINKRIRTTMIGALASIEKHFSFLWDDSLPEEIKDKHLQIYDSLRREILDRGNDQIRITKGEIANFEVNWLKYSITLPFKGQTNERN